MNLARLLIASAAVVLPASHLAAMDGPEAVAASDAFAPPSTPLILTRTLYRDLPGGGKIVVTRQYAVQFSTDADGYRLDGQLLDTMVQVPERLSALAEVERKRPDSGLFPAYLDRHGLIRSDAGPPRSSAHSDALQLAGRVLSKSALPPRGKEELGQAAGMIVTTSENSPWPAFLFNPGPGERTTTSRTALPDGSTGSIEVRVKADALMPGGLPLRISRLITTRLAGTERTTREVWTLAPKP
ncbi:hypothetical protein ACQKOE_10490 [Novosphingobium sp. NPDC080210]|uniref:hypothetical protein n=1 Tax=Novosphingobium sp. NPDC080210 TaxID=3390596 RepID=UPI003CFCA8B7